MVQAVIEIGSTGIRLQVSEIAADSGKKITILDTSERPVNIGRDVFTTSLISRETAISCVESLNCFAEQIKGWGIERFEATVIATSAVREAKNRDPFIDRVKVKTGFIVHVTDGIEENRLMYLAVRECLKNEKQQNSIILDIAGGSTEMMLLEKGRIVGAHSMRLGTVIIEQNLNAMSANLDDSEQMIGDFIRNAKNVLNSEMDLSKVKQFIVMGNDMRIMAKSEGRQVSENLWEIDRRTFEKFAEFMKMCTPEECVSKFGMNYSEVRTFQISLIAYRLFLEILNVDKIIVPETSIRDGIFLSRNFNDHKVAEDFNFQIATSATALLRKFQGDEKHAAFVRRASLTFYDAIRKEIALDEKARMILEISAILHDIGMFIGAANHNIHGKYIINNSEIFGINRDDKSLVAMIVSYHKGHRIPQDDEEFRLLPRSNRMMVLKLTAILRVADALDRSHKQSLSDIALHITDDSITVRDKNHVNTVLEKAALADKGDLFESVFGYKVVLV